MTWPSEVLTSPTRGSWNTKLNNKVISPGTTWNSWHHMPGSDLKCPSHKSGGFRPPSCPSGRHLSRTGAEQLLTQAQQFKELHLNQLNLTCAFSQSIRAHSELYFLFLPYRYSQTVSYRFLPSEDWERVSPDSSWPREAEQGWSVSLVAPFRVTDPCLGF